MKEGVLENTYDGWYCRNCASLARIDPHDYELLMCECKGVDINSGSEYPEAWMPVTVTERMVQR